MPRKQLTSAKSSSTVTTKGNSNQEDFDAFLQDEMYFFKKKKTLSADQPHQKIVAKIDNTNRADIIGNTGLVRKKGMYDNTTVASNISCMISTTNNHLECCMTGSAEPQHSDQNNDNHMHEINNQTQFSLVPETTFSSDKWSKSSLTNSA